MLPSGVTADPRTRRATLLVLFFVSGFVALLYQVIWQRLLGLVTGLDLHAATMVVAVFMLGMGVGSFAGGYLADRLAADRLLLVFAAAEGVAAAFALVSRPLYHGFFYKLAASAGASPLLVGATAASTLLLPTICMGVTLPVLSKAVSEAVDGAAGRIASLYGWNTLGAAAGAWIGSAWVIRSVGYDRSLWIGALLNLLCAAAAMSMRGRAGSAAPVSAAGPSAAPGVAEAERAWWRWPALYFLSGFVALGLEMVWFRLLGVTLKSTAFTFPLLLGFYLLGVGGGSLAGRALADKGRHPFRSFLAAQAAVPLYAGLSIAGLLWALRTQSSLAVRAREYLGSYEPIPFAFNFFDLTPPQLALYGVVPAVLILPPTLLMGASFVFLQKGAQSDLGRLGRRVGVLQAANIMGSAAGVALVGLLLLDRVGTPGTLRLLMAVAAIYVALGAASFVTVRWRVLRWSTGLAFAAIAIAGVRLIPNASTFWGQLHGVPPMRIIQAEDGTGIAVLTNRTPSFRSNTDVYVNGLGQSTIPFDGIHSFLGLVPVMLHPAPTRVAIIGLGSGDTAYSAAGRLETEQLYCIEIIGGQIRTLRQLYQRTGYPGLEGLLADPRIQHVVGDGRRYLMQHPEGFDVIEADALRPGSAYAGNLYSREYFELVRSRLRPAGLAVTWAPTSRIQHTFEQVFPYVADVSPMLVGSNEPIPFDAAVIRGRASQPHAIQHYQRAGIELSSHIEQLIATFRHRLRPVATIDEGLVNTDLFPRDELRVPE